MVKRTCQPYRGVLRENALSSQLPAWWMGRVATDERVGRLWGHELAGGALPGGVREGRRQLVVLIADPLVVGDGFVVDRVFDEPGQWFVIWSPRR
jgi:hypothetical protein